MAAQTINIDWLGYDDLRVSALESLLDFVRAFSLGKDQQIVTQSADIEDISQSLSGDGDAYRRLVERHQAGVGRLLWRFTRDRTEHEELVQQVFVEAYLGLAKYRGKAPFSHWLAKIATRTGYKFWRGNQNRCVALTDEMRDTIGGAIESELSGEKAAEVVHLLLEQLPRRDRLVLTMRYLAGHDVETTAAYTGWSQTLVRVQSHRAMGKLKKLVAKSNIELE